MYTTNTFNFSLPEIKFVINIFFEFCLELFINGYHVTFSSNFKDFFYLPQYDKKITPYFYSDGKISYDHYFSFHFLTFAFYITFCRKMKNVLLNKKVTRFHSHKNMLKYFNHLTSGYFGREKDHKMDRFRDKEALKIVLNAKINYHSNHSFRVEPASRLFWFQDDF